MSAPAWTLAQLVQRATEVDAETFTSELESPYLVATGTLEGRVDPGLKSQDTGLLELAAGGPSHSLAMKNPLAGRILPVTKRMKDDPARIYVGRSDANDVVVVDRSISAR